MKIVFLDVDGVIKPINAQTPINGFSSVCMDNLRKLLKKTGAKIVLSTSWREDERDLAFLRNELNKHGIDATFDIVGSTPILWELNGAFWDDDKDELVEGDPWLGTRGHEIAKFIESNLIDIEKFVILDDDPTPARKDWTELNGKFIQTKMNVGFDKEKFKQALDFLKD